MANKNMRTVKIYGMSGYKYQATPTIMLKGKWLEELGFEIGEMHLLTIGTINDIYTEMQNDENQGAYSTLASQDDMDRF